MKVDYSRFALSAALILTLSVASVGSQNDKAKSNPPAAPQAKTTQPATHFTQGTITSINANQMVITKQVRGKAEQTTFAFNSQTQRSGNLAAGTRVSVQYREDNGQKIVAAVRELPAETSVKDHKATYKARSKS
jgi:uncharacterized protein DUF5666